MEINEIVSQHLGKAGDGTVVKPYVTPDEVDPTLLVPVPRHLNRTQYGIDDNDLPFVGFDTWNAYEVSFLLNNGYPVSGVMKIVYDSNSPAIVESKSIKLYLNSYNMVRFGNDITTAIYDVEEQIANDLSAALDTDVKVFLHRYDDFDAVAPFRKQFERLEEMVHLEEISFEAYNEDPNILELEKAEGSVFKVTTNALRSNCRVTNQPDWGDVYIAIEGAEQTPTPGSLLQYIVSMRKENHFHEEICECIYKRLYDLYRDEEDVDIFVGCLYTRRGGIDINPVRCSNDMMLEEYAPALMDVTEPHKKTERQ